MHYQVNVIPAEVMGANKTALSDKGRQVTTIVTSGSGRLRGLRRGRVPDQHLHRRVRLADEAGESQPQPQRPVTAEPKPA